MPRVKKDLTSAYSSPFATALRSLMDEANIKQEELAQITGKTRQTVSQYVNGISEPGYDTLVKIADFFNVPVDYLLGRTKDRSRNPSAVDELGIPRGFIAWLRSIKIKEEYDRGLTDNIHQIFNNSLFHKLVFQIEYYISAKKAEKIYCNVHETLYQNNALEYSQLSDEELEEIELTFHDKIMEVTDSGIYSDSVRKAISDQIRLRKNFTIFDKVGFQGHDPIGINVSEIAAFNINRTIEQLANFIVDTPVENKNKKRGN